MTNANDLSLASPGVGWTKNPLWFRLLGAPKQSYRDGPRDRTWRMRWGELSLSRCPVGLSVGGYETAHLNVALGFGQVFIRLPFWDAAICTGPNSIEQPRWGFSLHASSVHLNLGKRYKIIDFFWQKRYLFSEFLAPDGRWLPRDQMARSWAPGEGIEPLEVHAPYHYLLDNGEVQHVTATMVRERGWAVWRWFGESTHPNALGHVKNPRNAWISDALRRIQKRLAKPNESIAISFSGEVGERAGSWKGGTVGCSWSMKPGETPERALRRMQRERRFR